jgi:hypothetical protein
MKKIFINIAILLSGWIAANAQGSIQATMKAGTQPNAVVVSIKPQATFTGIISSVSLSIAIPVSTGARPTATVINNYNSDIAYPAFTSTEVVEGVNSYVYFWLGDALPTATAKAYTQGVDNDLIQVAFNGGGSSAADIKMISLVDGGTSQQAYFYISVAGTDFTNEANMFYGTGASNSASGYAGYSFKPLSGINLPVNWLNFTAVKRENNAALSWAVQESNNDRFEIERSINGVDFSQVATVASKGAGTNNYELTDANITNLRAAKVYYRIKQVDRDGKFSYSNIATIKLSVDKAYNINIAPNPVINFTTLTLDVAKPTRGTAKVVDASGRAVLLVNLNLQTGINQTKLNMSSLASGNYNVNVVTEDGLQETIRVVKQ